MSQVVLWICKKNDLLYAAIKEFKPEKKGSSIDYDIYRFADDIYVLVRNDNSFSEVSNNNNFWNKTTFEHLAEDLKAINDNKDILVAIHWGGLNNSAALEEVQKNTDKNYRLNGCKHYLTFYSENNEKFEWDNLEQFQSNSDIVRNRLKDLQSASAIKIAVDFWLPLAIDLQGLRDSDAPKEYFEQVNINYKNYRTTDKRNEWENIEDELDKMALAKVNIWDKVFNENSDLQTDFQQFSEDLNLYLSPLSERLK